MTIIPARVLADRAVTHYRIAADVAAAAALNLTAGVSRIVNVSGKMGSGKDFWAPRIHQMYGTESATAVSFAFPMKSEVNDVLDTIASARTREQAQAAVADRFTWSAADAADFVGFVWAHHADLPSWDAHQRDRLPAESRTALRSLLQQYGTRRRGHDVGYWVRAAAPAIMQAAADGRHVQITDARFPNEADISVELGWTLVRIDIDPQVQRDRLLARDGIVYDDAQLTHISETALDDYPFPIRVDNNGPVEATDAKLRAALGLTADVTIAA